VADASDSAPKDHWANLGTSLDVLGDREHHRWEDRCRAQAALTGATWPGPEARALVEAILGSLASNDSQPVVTAARAWAHTSPSVSTLVRQMGVLREVLAADDVCAFPDLDDRLVRIMDQATTTATAEALTELEDAALTDALTGVGNRRALETAATAALASTRSDVVVSIVVIDLDGLKSINDTDGHVAGDRAIAGLTEALRAALRDTDQLFRIGGDEFVALLPLAPIDTVSELMTRARECDAPAFSWGAATAPEDGTELETLLARADERLYGWRRTTRGTGRPALAALRDDVSPGRRHRRARRIRVVAAVLVLSALLGVALHFLVKSHSARPNHSPGHSSSPYSPTPGSGGGNTTPPTSLP
jgi:diguanylate cyclase (GGDEF)-like protein